jgi:hypothetical protein
MKKLVDQPSRYLIFCISDSPVRIGHESGIIGIGDNANSHS